MTLCTNHKLNKPKSRPHPGTPRLSRSLVSLLARGPPCAATVLVQARHQQHGSPCGKGCGRRQPDRRESDRRGGRTVHALSEGRG